MKVSILSPDLSHNCLGRAYLLAELLERNYEVEIIGPKFDEEIWPPIQDEYDYRSVDTRSLVHSFVRSVPEILNLVTGDVILASKPRFSSFGVALLKKLSEDLPLVLDIDDWESGFRYGRGRLFAYALGIPGAINVNSFYYTRFLEGLSSIADARTVSNRFLQNKFGGKLIHHARDIDVFDPERYDGRAVREEFNLPIDSHLVMFSGTPRPHKGVDDLVRAVSSLDRDDIRVIIVGAHESDYVARLRRIGGDSLIIRGQQPFDEIPRWIAAADVIAIPQREMLSTRGQMPAKVFDAMAMGKPIVATNISDLPKVLAGCGYLVDSESVEQLKDAITYLFENEKYRQNLGRQARKRCVDKYSYDAVAPRLSKVIESVSNQ